MLRAFGGDEDAIARYAAVLGIVGVLEIPVIHVSVRLLQGIHPAVLTHQGGRVGPDRSDDARHALRRPRSRCCCSPGGWWRCACARCACEAEAASLRRLVEAHEGAAA